MFASDPPAVRDPRGDLDQPPLGASPVVDSVFRAIGRTPLLPLRRLSRDHGGTFELYGKAEFLNPSGSVKDRAAASIVESAWRSGRLSPKHELVDATSGNTGVAYALLGARMGFAVTLFVPRTVHPERLERMETYGAHVVLTDPLDGTDGAQRAAKEWAAADPARRFYADQYNNPANPAAHYRTTGPEIWAELGPRLTHFVAGVGTGGTISGASRYLKEQRATITTVGVQPDGPLHGLEGLKHLPTALRPSTYDERWVDVTERVSTEEAETLRERLGALEGIAVGRSAAAALVAALRVGEARPGAVLVAILPDSSSEGLRPGGLR